MNYLHINLFILAVAMLILFVGIIQTREAEVRLKDAILFGLGWSCFIGVFDATEIFMVL